MTKPLAKLTGRRLTAQHPLYDRNHRVELDRRLQDVGRWKGASGAAMWKEGLEFLVIRDKKLFRQDGFASMADWLQDKLDRVPRTVAKRMALAENFPLALVRLYSSEKLLKVLRYTGRTRAPDEPWHLETLELEVPVGDGRVEKVPFPKASVRQIAAAIAHQGELADDRAARALPAEQRPVVEQLHEAVLLEGSGRPLADIKVRPAKSGLLDDAMVTVTVRLGDLHATTDRLARALEPKPKPKRRQ